MTSALLEYSMAANLAVTAETRREQTAISGLAFDGAMYQASEDVAAGTLSTPGSNSYTIGSQTVTVWASDNGVSITHTLLLTASTSNKGRTFNTTRVVGLKTPASYWWYSLGIGSDETFNGPVTLGSGGKNGDLYAGGNLTINRSATINGDLEVTGTLASIMPYTVTGKTYTHALGIVFPTIVDANYTSGALPYLLGTMAGDIFVGNYLVTYRNGNLTLSGGFTGKGVLFIKGDLTIGGNISYLAGADRMAVIVTGNITFTNSNTSIAGYYFCGGTCTVAAGQSVTIAPGSLVCNVLSVSATGSLAINYDPIIWTTIGEGRNMKLPGLWP